MSNGPQVEDGYTPIANELLEAISHTNFTSREFRCIMFLIRKTYGWKDKKTDKIALSQWSAGTGIGKGHVAETLKRLAKCNVISMEKTGKGRTALTVYGLNKHYDQWLEKVPTGGTISEELDPTGGTELDPTGGTTKERKKEAAATATDNWLGEYERVWGKLVGSMAEAEEIDEWKTRIPFEVWTYALTEAKDANAKNWKYMRSILKRVEIEGLPVNGHSGPTGIAPKSVNIEWGELTR